MTCLWVWIDIVLSITNISGLFTEVSVIDIIYLKSVHG